MAGLRTAVVLATTEDACTVVSADGPAVVPYAPFFPRPRVDRVSPGHLVALDTGARPEHVVWRWFDAVVVGRDGEAWSLWEPHHGSVTARPRDPQAGYRTGSRAYTSAGLPGADWWVESPVDGSGHDVDLEAVERFLTENGLRNSLG